MEIGVTLRNMGPQSTVDTMVAGAQAAEALGFESIWITDHIAIPPDDAEGSGGRYLDPLVSLAFLAGETSSIRLGTGVLILPYRPALPTVKQIATLQELSRERLLLGVGIGWMDAEFRALDVERRRRGPSAMGYSSFSISALRATPLRPTDNPSCSNQDLRSHPYTLAGRHRTRSSGPLA